MEHGASDKTVIGKQFCLHAGMPNEGQPWMEEGATKCSRSIRQD